MEITQGPFVHEAVMVAEVVSGLNLQKDGIYVDLTFGRGGHSRAILENLSEKAQVFAMDKDPEAALVAKNLEILDLRFKFKADTFSHVVEFCEFFGIKGQVNGLLMDLGVSSPQLEDEKRGFSFIKNGPLDMRMDPTQGISAADWINTAEESQIQKVFKEYGEERFNKRIARAIVETRRENPITTTEQLSEIIKRAHPAWEKHKHPATRCFQAIRIYINRELEELATCLEQVVSILAPNGRLVVISFHSLEDRAVKHFIQQHEQDQHPRDLPILANTLPRILQRVGNKQKPTPEEINRNRRARSAVLRVAEKVGYC